MAESSNAGFEVRNGARLEEFRTGKEGPQIWRARDMNRLVRSLNALLNPQIVRGEQDKVEISDGNITIQLASSTDGTGSALQLFKLATPTVERQTVVGNDYLVCRTYDPDSNSTGATDVYIAKDYALRCSITGETVLGEAVTYSYAADPADVATYPQNKIRTVTRTSDSATEDQVIVRPYVPGEWIYAAEAEKTGVTVAGEKLTLIEMRPARQWAKATSS